MGSCFAEDVHETVLYDILKIYKVFVEAIVCAENADWIKIFNRKEEYFKILCLQILNLFKTKDFKIISTYANYTKISSIITDILGIILKKFKFAVENDDRNSMQFIIRLMFRMSEEFYKNIYSNFNILLLIS